MKKGQLLGVQNIILGDTLYWLFLQVSFMVLGLSEANFASTICTTLREKYVFAHPLWRCLVGAIFDIFIAEEVRDSWK